MGLMVYIVFTMTDMVYLILSGGRGRYGDGPYNCNGGDGGK